MFAYNYSFCFFLRDGSFVYWAPRRDEMPVWEWEQGEVNCSAWLRRKFQTSWDNGEGKEQRTGKKKKEGERLWVDLGDNYVDLWPLGWIILFCDPFSQLPTTSSIVLD